MRRFIALAVFAIACGGAPPPSAPTTRAPRAPVATTFVSRAPESTRLLFHVTRAGAFFAQGGSKLAKIGVDAVETGCGIDLTRDVGDIEGWVTEEGETRIEIGGAFTMENAACVCSLLGLSKKKHTKALELGPFRATPRLGGGVVLATASAEEGRGAPSALAARFGSLLASADLTLAIRTDTGVFDTTMRVSGRTIEITAHPGADLAARAVKAIRSTLDAAKARGATKLAAVTVEQNADALVLRVEPDPDLALELRKYALESFKVPSGSMIPTLEVGDHLFALKDGAGTLPERGEVVVFDDERGQTFVKRVVALPGDKVGAHGDRVTINGVDLVETRVREMMVGFEGDTPQHGVVFTEKLGTRTHEIVLTSENGGLWDVDATIPPNHVYVMGDNRNNSHDSRAFGPIPIERIKARAALVYLSLGSNGVPHWNRLFHVID